MPVDGVKFAYSLSSPLSWVELDNLRDLPSPPASVADKLDITTHGNARRKAYKSGMMDTPDITARFLLDLSDAAQLAMITARDAGTELWFRCEIPSNEAKTLFLGWEWQGYVSKADALTPVGGVWEFDLVIQYSDNYQFWSTPAATEIT